MYSVADLRGLRLAVNGMTSYSGYRVWRHILPAGDDVQSYFGEIVTSGSHRASIRCVAAGEADACAVDCVTHALLSDQSGEELRGTRILASSPTAPGMPYVTGVATSDDDVERLRAGLLAAIADPSLGARAQGTPPHRRERPDRRGVPQRVRGLARRGGGVAARRALAHVAGEAVLDEAREQDEEVAHHQVHQPRRDVELVGLEAAGDDDAGDAGEIQ